jgi:hypothetical protein
MTSDEFNEKYKDYLGERHYGLGFDFPEITEMLDQEFEKFIQIPGFKYFQIKLKFGKARFYAEGIPLEESYRIEDIINETLLKNKV